MRRTPWRGIFPFTRKARSVNNKRAQLEAVLPKLESLRDYTENGVVLCREDMAQLPTVVSGLQKLVEELAEKEAEFTKTKVKGKNAEQQSEQLDGIRMMIATGINGPEDLVQLGHVWNMLLLVLKEEQLDLSREAQAQEEKRSKRPKARATRKKP